MTLEDRIRARISVIPEPCAIAMGSKQTLGGMGLIEAVAVADNHATITLCLTDTACVHFAAMQAYIADALADLGLAQITVRQTLDELWTPDRMAEA